MERLKGIPPRKTFFTVILAASALCLAAGYGLAGQLIGVVAAVITGIAWLPARKYPNSGLPLLCFLAAVGSAVAGILTGAPALLMICGSGLALAAWDLLFLDVTLDCTLPGVQTRKYEYDHLRSVVMAVAAGLMVVLFGHFINLRIPFLVLALLVLLAVFSLNRIWGYIKRKDRRL